MFSQAWFKTFCFEIDKISRLVLIISTLKIHEILRLGSKPLRLEIVQVSRLVPTNLFPDMPCMKRVYRDKKASVHWSVARDKERFSSRV